MHAPAGIWPASQLRGALPRACLFTEASLGQELDLQVGFESLVNIRMQWFVMSGRCGQLRKCVSYRAFSATLWGVALRKKGRCFSNC